MSLGAAFVADALDSGTDIVGCDGSGDRDCCCGDVGFAGLYAGERANSLFDIGLAMIAHHAFYAEFLCIHNVIVIYVRHIMIVMVMPAGKGVDKQCAEQHA